MKKINVCLIEPEIPQNTGNIARTCAVTGARLHLVKPFGFEIDSAKLRRAGLDYWDKLDITYYDSLDDFLRLHSGDPLLFYTQKGKTVFSEIDYPDDVWLVFGKESCGLPQKLLEDNADKTVRIPMREGIRSLNLGNSVAIAVYEVLRTENYEGLKCKGILSDADV
ncbi:MAG: tRNA (cytidine(34)-2'-O)-methyltransferase [Clostridia bacterium]|nr:tRNA (cytidine(34)-2'-O)-methyltransferase [Clostridia bacterium]